MSYLGELLSHLTSYAAPSDAEPSDAEPTEAKNTLGYKIWTLFKNYLVVYNLWIDWIELFIFISILLQITITNYYFYYLNTKT